MRTLIVLLGVVIASAHAADKPLAETARETASLMKAGGIVVGESIGGNTVFSGFAAAGGNAADYTEKVLFEIGSISKLFTGLLLAQAVVEGKVTLDTRIDRLLPSDLKFADPRIAAITLKQLSTHTSGLPRLPANHGAGVRGNDPYAAYDETLMLDFLTHAKLKEDGPYPCSYSNLGVGLLGHLLGKVYQTTWEEAIVRKICDPLELRHTRMTITDLPLKLAPPFKESSAAVSWHFDAVAGAGALRSNAADLMRFGKAMLQPEKTPLAAAFALAMQPQADAEGSAKIGLGPFIVKRDGRTIYNHTGGTGGYRTGFQVIPETATVRIVLMNNTQFDGNYPIARTRVEPPRVMPKEISLPAAVLEDYTGVYLLDGETRFTLLLQDGQLWARLTGQPFFKLFARETDRFFYKAVNAEIQFDREAGRVSALTLFQNGNELKALKAKEPAPSIRLHPAAELRPYTGTYAVMGLKMLTVSLRGTTLFARLEDQEEAPIFDMGQERFEFDVVEAALVFTRNEQGDINGLLLDQNGLKLPAARSVTEKTGAVR